MDMIEIIGTLTILLSLVGLSVALSFLLFFGQSRKPLARRLKLVFLSDALIYFVTALFGFWAYFEWSFSTAIALQWLRIPVLALNIIASVMLYRHYRQLK